MVKVKNEYSYPDKVVESGVLSKSKLAPYDFLKVPSSMVDWANVGKLWKSGFNGSQDNVVKQKFEGLLKAGYDIHSFCESGTNLVILFKLK